MGCLILKFKDSFDGMTQHNDPQTAERQNSVTFRSKGEQVRATQGSTLRVIANWSYRRQFSEKAIAPHSSTLAWKIPRMEEPGRLQSMGWLRVGHNWATSLSLFTFMHWRRKWQPTPVFFPGESQGQGSLVGCQTSMPTQEAAWIPRRNSRIPP